MSTKPTRQQERAGDLLAEALLRIAEAARIDGGPSFAGPEIDQIGRAIAATSRTFGLGEIVSRATEARGQALGLRAGTAELLGLVLDEANPILRLFMTDETFRELVARAEAELGEID